MSGLGYRVPIYQSSLATEPGGAPRTPALAATPALLLRARGDAGDQQQGLRVEDDPML